MITRKPPMVQQRQPIRDKWGKTPSEVFNELLVERGISKYATVTATQDGVDLPSGIESQVWWVLTPDENVQTYALRWDEDKQAPDGSRGYYVLLISEAWSRDSIEEMRDDSDYLRARKELRLPLTEEQEKILQKWEEEHKVR